MANNKTSKVGSKKPTPQAGRPTVIVPDLRTKINGLETLLAASNADEIVFLGNYFDDSATLEDNQAAARWLKKSLWIPGRVHLLSAYDLQYAFEFVKTPTFNKNVSLAVNGILTELDWASTHFHHWSKGCLLTSAGLDIRAIYDLIPDEDERISLIHLLASAEAGAWRSLLLSKKHWLYDISGDDPTGVTFAKEQKRPIADTTQLHSFLPCDNPLRHSLFDGSGECISIPPAKPTDALPPCVARLYDNGRITFISTVPKGSSGVSSVS